MAFVAKSQEWYQLDLLLWCRIIAYLTIKDVAHLAQTCQHFRSLINDNDVVWETLYRTTFMAPVPIALDSLKITLGALVTSRGLSRHTLVHALSPHWHHFRIRSEQSGTKKHDCLASLLNPEIPSLTDVSEADTLRMGSVRHIPPAILHWILSHDSQKLSSHQDDQDSPATLARGPLDPRSVEETRESLVKAELMVAPSEVKGRIWGEPQVGTIPAPFSAMAMPDYILTSPPTVYDGERRLFRELMSDGGGYTRWDWIEPSSSEDEVAYKSVDDRGGADVPDGGQEHQGEERKNEEKMLQIDKISFRRRKARSFRRRGRSPGSAMDGQSVLEGRLVKREQRTTTVEKPRTADPDALIPVIDTTIPDYEDKADLGVIKLIEAYLDAIPLLPQNNHLNMCHGAHTASSSASLTFSPSSSSGLRPRSRPSPYLLNVPDPSLKIPSVGTLGAATDALCCGPEGSPALAWMRPPVPDIPRDPLQSNDKLMMQPGIQRGIPSFPPLALLPHQSALDHLSTCTGSASFSRTQPSSFSHVLDQPMWELLPVSEIPWYFRNLATATTNSARVMHLGGPDVAPLLFQHASSFHSPSSRVVTSRSSASIFSVFPSSSSSANTSASPSSPPSPETFFRDKLIDILRTISHSITAADWGALSYKQRYRIRASLCPLSPSEYPLIKRAYFLSCSVIDSLIATCPSILHTLGPVADCFTLNKYRRSITCLPRSASAQLTAFYMFFPGQMDQCIDSGLAMGLFGGGAGDGVTHFSTYLPTYPRCLRSSSHVAVGVVDRDPRSSIVTAYSLTPYGTIVASLGGTARTPGLSTPGHLQHHAPQRSLLVSPSYFSFIASWVRNIEIGSISPSRPPLPKSIDDEALWRDHVTRSLCKIAHVNRHTGDVTKSQSPSFSDDSMGHKQGLSGDASIVLGLEAMTKQIVVGTRGLTRKACHVARDLRTALRAHALRQARIRYDAVKLLQTISNSRSNSTISSTEALEHKGLLSHATEVISVIKRAESELLGISTILGLGHHMHDLLNRYTSIDVSTATVPSICPHLQSSSLHAPPRLGPLGPVSGRFVFAPSYLSDDCKPFKPVRYGERNLRSYYEGERLAIYDRRQAGVVEVVHKPTRSTQALGSNSNVSAIRNSPVNGILSQRQTHFGGLGEVGAGGATLGIDSQSRSSEYSKSNEAADSSHVSSSQTSYTYVSHVSDPLASFQHVLICIKAVLGDSDCLSSPQMNSSTLSHSAAHSPLRTNRLKQSSQLYLALPSSLSRSIFCRRLATPSLLPPYVSRHQVDPRLPEYDPYLPRYPTNFAPLPSTACSSWVHDVGMMFGSRITPSLIPRPMPLLYPVLSRYAWQGVGTSDMITMGIRVHASATYLPIISPLNGRQCFRFRLRVYYDYPSLTRGRGEKGAFAAERQIGDIFPIMRDARPSTEPHLMPWVNDYSSLSPQSASAPSNLVTQPSNLTNQVSNCQSTTRQDPLGNNGVQGVLSNNALSNSRPITSSTSTSPLPRLTEAGSFGGPSVSPLGYKRWYGAVYRLSSYTWQIERLSPEYPAQRQSPSSSSSSHSLLHGKVPPHIISMQYAPTSVLGQGSVYSLGAMRSVPLTKLEDPSDTPPHLDTYLEKDNRRTTQIGSHQHIPKCTSSCHLPHHYDASSCVCMSRTDSKLRMEAPLYAFETAEEVEYVQGSTLGGENPLVGEGVPMFEYESKCLIEGPRGCIGGILVFRRDPDAEYAREKKEAGHRDEIDDDDDGWEQDMGNGERVSPDTRSVDEGVGTYTFTDPSKEAEEGRNVRWRGRQLSTQERRQCRDSMPSVIIARFGAIELDVKRTAM